MSTEYNGNHGNDGKYQRNPLTMGKFLSQAIPLEFLEALLYILGWQIPIFDIVDGIFGGLIDIYLFILAYSLIGKRAYPILIIEILDLVEWIFVIPYLMWFEILPIWTISVLILGRHPTLRNSVEPPKEQVCSSCGSIYDISKKKCSSCGEDLDE